MIFPRPKPDSLGGPAKMPVHPGPLARGNNEKYPNPYQSNPIKSNRLR